MTKVKTYRINIEGTPNNWDAIIFWEGGVMSTSHIGSAAAKDAWVAPGDVPVIWQDWMLSSQVLPAAQWWMTTKIYDPDDKRVDVYQMDNMEQWKINKFVSAEEKTKIENLDNSLNSKVSKTNSASQLYWTNGESSETTVTYSSSAQNNSIAARTDTGTIKASTPASNDDVTTKQYVDNADWWKQDKPMNWSWAPHIIPSYIWQQYVDITNLKLYTAIWTSSQDDWMQAATGDGSVFDPTGYYNKLHAWYADFLYSDDSVNNFESWEFRTTGWSTSIKNWNAIVKRVLWNSKHIQIPWIPPLFSWVDAYDFALPTSISATWVNQRDWVITFPNSYVDSETWMITTDQWWTRSVICVKVAWWVTNWYFIKNFWIESNHPSMDVWYANTTSVTTGTELGYLWTLWWNTWEYNVEIENNGWIAISALTTTFNETFSVHPARSWQQNWNSDPYVLHTLNMPTEWVLEWTETTVTLPYTTDWLRRIWDIYDEINFITKQYIKRIDRMEWTQENKDAIVNSWRAWMECADWIYYELENPIIYNIESENEYLANDYWTESVSYILWVSSSPTLAYFDIDYWVNLTDKLKSDVLVKWQQTLTAWQRSQVLTNLWIHIVSELPANPIAWDLYVLTE